MVSQAQMKKEAKKEKEKKMVVGWSTERMKEDRSKRDFQDTDEMERSIKQEEVDHLWKIVRENGG